MDRSRYDSAMFWLPFGTAAAVIGLALMTIGITRLRSSDNVFGSAWFDGGLGLLAIGGVMLLWALWLFLSRRRSAGASIEPPATGSGNPNPARPSPAGKDDWLSEAVRGYYRERENMFRFWQRSQKDKKEKKNPT